MTILQYHYEGHKCQDSVSKWFLTGRVDGQTYLSMKDGGPQQRAATKDAHFTVLGFTAANGKPLMCAIIFAAKSLKEEWRLGFDPFMEWIGEEDDYEDRNNEQQPKMRTSPC